MHGNDLNRRIAAWLLTLPGPFPAASPQDALRAAQSSFNASLYGAHSADADFSDALSDLGYWLRRQEGRFSIAIAMQDAPKKAAHQNHALYASTETDKPARDVLRAA